MKVRQLRSHLSQTHPARNELVAGPASELLEAFNPLTLGGRALNRGHLGDDTHRLQRGNASFKPLCLLFAFCGKAESALIADGMALLASLSVEEVLGEVATTLPRRNHPVQRSAGGSSG